MAKSKPSAKSGRDISSYFKKPDSKKPAKPAKATKPTKSSDNEDYMDVSEPDNAVEDEEMTDVDPEDDTSDAPEAPKTKSGARPGARQKDSDSNARSFVQTTKDAPHLSSLPPISHIPSMFQDIVKRIPEIKKVAERIRGRPLRVATMCSGTESPLLALGLIARTLKEDHDVVFDVEHVFSCEIEPFKQAYIERNFHPPILFRDVCELGQDEATTAYGAKVKVPGNVDVLIAGTSCVDYSTLNNEKQDIDANGESGRTFRGMLEWVVKHRPTIVILENVCGAPWNRVVEKFKKVDYSAVHQRLDTKNYYIPHTRTRGYLMAVDQKDSSIPTQWKQKVAELARPASSTLDAFLLESDDPRIHSARQKLVHEGANHERKAGYDWGRCESRHLKARHEEELGSRRPLTGWEEGGTSKLPSFAWNDWAGVQVDRVWDLMDITTLRAAQNGKDPLYKTEVWNLSQNVDRQIGSSRIGIAPCLTPTMIPYVTNRGGPMVGMEALGLQGLPVDELLLTRETEDQLADLAGNAMSSTVVGSAILAALTLSRKFLTPGPQDEDEAMDVDEPSPDSSVADAIQSEEQLSEDTLDLSATTEHSLPSLLIGASDSIRYCECEGRDDIVRRAVQRCVDCGSTSCIKCGGRPEHNYAPVDTDAHPRLPPSAYRKEVKNQLPMSVSIEGVTENLLEKTKDIVGDTSISEKTWHVWRSATLSAVASSLTFKEDKRQETWVIVYDSPTAVLEFHLHPLRPEWLLYAKPADSEGANSPTRVLLSRPIARLVCNDNLFDGVWELGIPSEQSFEVQIEGTGPPVLSWEAKLGLESKKHKDKKVWSNITISFDDENAEFLDRNIAGSYVYLDKCGTANSALHKKENESPDLPPVFLLLEPTRCGAPEDDCFVFSSSIRRCEYGENRSTYATLDKSWRPNDREGKSSVTCHIHSRWISNAKISIQPTENLIARVSRPIGTLPVHVSNDSCASASALLVCKVPLSPADASAVWPRNKWATVDAIHERATFKALSWVLERVQNIEHLNTWTHVEHSADHMACERCAPTPPMIRWTRTTKGIAAIEDPYQAGRYEQALKHRPSPFVTQLRLDVDSSVGTVRLGLNVPSLIHRALSRLPTIDRTESPRFSWRLTTNYTPPPRLSLPKFVLKSNRSDPSHDQPPNFKLDLRPEQLRSLNWMIEQESKDTLPFMEEEISEAILKPLGWRVEGMAQRPVRISGGVIADEVGYGKTAITLGLIDSTADSVPKRKKGPTPHGKIPTNANLIVVPAHLTRQWASEIKKFLGKTYKVITLENMTHVNKLTIQDVLDADIILVASRLVKSDTYLANLQAFAAAGNLPTKEGRYFEAKLKQVHESLKGQTKRLMEEGSSAVLDSIREAIDNPEDDFLLTSKRLKGKQYRDKVHEDTVLRDTTQVAAAPNAVKKPKQVVEVVITVPPPPSSSPIDSDGGSPRVKKSPSHIVISSDDEGIENGPDAAARSKTSKTTVGLTKKRKVEERDESDESPDSESDQPVAKKSKATKSSASKTKVEKKPVKKLYETDPWGLKSSSVRRDWKEMLCPPLELFHFHRVIVDEYTYVEGKIYPLITSLRSNHRWILSGTPPTQDFASVKSIAAFMGIHLGIDDDFWEGQTKESLREAKKRQKEQTSAENFHSFREVHSLDWHAHRHDVAQSFLDQFVRQNLAEIDEIPFEDVVRPIVLPAAERAIYLELEHHLRALDMTIRKGKKTDSDREKRMNESLGNSSTAEEALLKRCSHFELEEDRSDNQNALKACEIIVEERTNQLEACVVELGEQITKALNDEKQIGPTDYNSHFRVWLRMAHSDNGVGDKDAKVRLHSIQADAGYDHERDGKKKTSPNFETESQKTKDARWKHREHSHVLKKLEKELVGRVRSLRYFTVVRDLQQKSEHVEHVSCPQCGKEDLPISDIAILSSCGHTGCHDCVLQSAQQEECVSHRSEGCNAAARVLNIVKAETLGADEERNSEVKHFGMKLEKVVQLIKNEISKKDRVLLFVQFPDLMVKVGEALAANEISFLEIKGSNSAKAKNLEKFQDPKGEEKVLLLNVGDESASGANLTTANHVIFLSPLLTMSQQFYEATDIQAIGRLRRYGQQKKVHIYRFLTLNSIDVEIFEARDGRKVE